VRPSKSSARRTITSSPARPGPRPRKEFDQLESLFAWTLWELGAAKVDPETIKIPKPGK
jgi:hypothetical protein